MRREQKERGKLFGCLQLELVLLAVKLLCLQSNEVLI